MSSSIFSIQAPILTGSNYESWSKRLEAILQSHGCLDCIETGFVEPDATALATMTAVQRNKLEELKQKEGKAKSCILNSLDDSIFPKITGVKTAKEAWDILKLAYQGNEKVKIVRLQNLRT